MYVCICVYIYIYIYLWARADGDLADVKGNHFSDATCLTCIFFSGESCSKLWRSLTRRRTHKSSEAVLDR